MGWEEAFELMVKGALVIAGVVLVLVVVGVGALIVLPFVLGLLITIIAWALYDRVHELLYPVTPLTLEEIEYKLDLQRIDREHRERDKAEDRRRELIRKGIITEEPETALDDNTKEEIVEEEYDLTVPLHLDNQLTFSQKEKLYAKGYQVLKTSAFGDSGAAHYWVMPRHNESKEHAFFCYILERELKKYVNEVEMNVTNGPDLVVKWKGNEYCFDVETGKSLSRQPEWLEKKFAYYQKEYDKSFILVTKRTLKYKYSKYGLVITRGMIKETIKKLFRKQLKKD